MDEDRSVTDLNAVQFVLEQILPFLIDYGDYISPALRAELLEAVRLGAEEIARLNVAVWYTNITLLDTLNTVLAGQVLDEEGLLRLGRQRIDEWIAYINRSGAVLEYNSSTYAAVDLAALAKLAHRAIDPAIRVKAQVMGGSQLFQRGDTLAIHDSGCHGGVGCVRIWAHCSLRR